MNRSFTYLALLAGLSALIFSSVGCSTTEPDNVSARPWNSPQGWTGMPSSINEGR